MADSKITSFASRGAAATNDILWLQNAASSSDYKLTIDSLLSSVTNLTEDTAPDRAADFVLSNDAAGAAGKVLMKNVGAYTVQFGGLTAFNPADGTTYYIDLGAHRTTDANARIYIPRAGKIIAAYVRFLNGGTGTTETSTVSIRLNSTSDTAISSSVVNNSANTIYNNTALSIAVSAGHYISIAWTTPTWVTNPTSVTVDGVVFIA